MALLYISNSELEKIGNKEDNFFFAQSNNERESDRILVVQCS
jgi:hypothetical protein